MVVMVMVMKAAFEWSDCSEEVVVIAFVAVIGIVD